MSAPILARACGCPVNAYHRGGCPSAPRFGFTGRGDDLTVGQSWALRRLLAQADAQTLHLGDSAGSDIEMRALAEAFGTDVTVHPDRTDGGDRNHDIVDSCDQLWAAPPTQVELENSGTWATIRYAREVGRPITIAWPDGSLGWES